MNRDYIKTKPQIIDKIKEKVSQKSTLHLWQEISQPDEVGGPRSRKQLSNMKYNEKRRREREENDDGYKKNIADHFQNLENMVKTDGTFVRSVKVSQGRVPAAVLYTDDQMKDLQRFCFSGPLAKTTVLGFDKTFNLSELHVTAAVFKNLAVKRRQTGEHPLFLGPMVLHGTSDFETFHFFFSDLSSSSFLRGSPSQPVFIFDDEPALHSALKHVFTESSGLFCTKHMKDNMSEFLKVAIFMVTNF